MIFVIKYHAEPHPNNDNLMVAKYGNHTFCTGKHYHEGQLGFYIPEGTIVPDKLLEEMWLKGRLAGKKKNIVKSRMMNGILSEGLFYGSQGASWNPAWKEGDEISKEVGL